MNDLRAAWRQMQRNRGFALAAVCVLSLGMTAFVTAFSVITRVLWHPLPLPDPGRVVVVSERRGDLTSGDDVSADDFAALRTRVRMLQQVSAVEPRNLDFSSGTHPEVVKAGRVTENFFEAFGVHAVRGRVFGPDDYRPGRRAVAVLTWRFWREHFHGDPHAVGTVIRLDDEPHTIVGVLPDRFETAILRSHARRELFTPASLLEGRVQMVARLPAGTALDTARAELDALAPQLAVAAAAAAPYGFRALPVREHVVAALRPALGIAGAAILLVLLLACVNVANLLLARSFGRSDEFAVRLALGASRRRLVVQVFAESLLLSGFAGILSTCLAGAALRGLARLGPPGIPFLDTVSLDVRAVLVAMVLVPAVAAVASVIPAVRVAFRARLLSTARTSTGGDQRAWRSALVICQIALAMALVTGAALLLRSFSNLVREDVGFERDRAAVLQIMAWSRQAGPDARRSFFEEARARLAALPGVEAAGAVSAMPFIEANIDIRSPLTIAGHPASAGQPPPMVSVSIVTPGYFEAVGGRLLQGRLLDARDAPGRAETAVISDALARRHFRDRNPIGTRIQVSLQRRPRVVEVVGVVASFRHEGLDALPRDEVFLPHAQAPFGAMTFVLRTGMDPAAVLGPARAAIWSIDPEQSFYQTGTLEQLVGETVAVRRFTLWLIGIFAGLSLVLAAAGVYGLLSTVVVLYRRELGIRIALGAGRLRVVGLVLGRGIRMAAAGVVIGLLSTAAGSQLLRGFLYGVEPVDPVVFAGAAWLMLMVTAMASYLPARRAAATDPARVLGGE